MKAESGYNYRDLGVAVRRTATKPTTYGPSPRALAERVRRIENALREERWLPIGLRSLLAHDLPWMRRRLATGGRAWRAKVAQRAHELAMASFRYGGKLLDSEAVTQLRVLDLELNPVHVTSETVEEWRHGMDPKSRRLVACGIRRVGPTSPGEA